MADAVFNDTTSLGTCPGCGKDLSAQTTCKVVMLEQQDLGSDVANARVEILGVRIQHDCIPKATR